MDVDLGVLIIRLAIGVTLIVHGLNKLFGPGGLQGTEAWFSSLGLRPAWLHARLAAATEIGAGALMAVGLLTGLAAAAFIGLMAVATLTDHRGKGFFVFKGGWEYTVVLAAVSVAVASIGPGDWSLDHVFGLDLAGIAWSIAATAIGGIAGAGLLVAFLRPEPKPGQSAP
ncbi:MAG: DoxX family protein [Aeromicrobium sp.]